MFKRSGRFVVSLKLIMGSSMLGITLLMNSSSALAMSSSGSVTVTAVVAPVRYILVNDNDKITEVLSNSHFNVTPVVYRNKFNTVPIALNLAVRSQYLAILPHLDTRHAGVIYRLPKAGSKNPASLFGNLHLQLNQLSVSM